MMLLETTKPELLWLAYLLTGDRETSVNAVVDAMDNKPGSNPFFRNWMISWSRKLVIAQALGAIESEMADSVRRTGTRRHDRSKSSLSANWSLQNSVDKARLEQALLAIDLFPRCALLLRVFEKVSLEDTAILLNASQEQVKAAQAIGLTELTRNLAGEREAAPSWNFCGRFCTSAR